MRESRKFDQQLFEQKPVIGISNVIRQQWAPKGAMSLRIHRRKAVSEVSIPENCHSPVRTTCQTLHGNMEASPLAATGNIKYRIFCGIRVAPLTATSISFRTTYLDRRACRYGRSCRPQYKFSYPYLRHWLSSPRLEFSHSLAGTGLPLSHRPRSSWEPGSPLGSV